MLDSVIDEDTTENLDVVPMTTAEGSATYLRSLFNVVQAPALAHVSVVQNSGYDPATKEHTTLTEKLINLDYGFTPIADKLLAKVI